MEEVADLGAVKADEDPAVEGTVSLTAAIGFIEGDLGVAVKDAVALGMVPDPPDPSDIMGLGRLKMEEEAAVDADAGADADIVIGASDLLGDNDSLTGPPPSPSELVTSFSL